MPIDRDRLGILGVYGPLLSRLRLFLIWECLSQLNLIQTTSRHLLYLLPSSSTLPPLNFSIFTPSNSASQDYSACEWGAKFLG